MKKLILLIILISLGGLSSQEAKGAKVVSKNKFATEELPSWFSKFSYDPVVNEIMDSIKREYPKLLKDIALIKSGALNGLNIDFVGMMHFVPSSDSRMTDLIRKSQNSIKKLIEVKKYDCIGTENFSVIGSVNYSNALDDQTYNTSQLLRIAYNVKSVPSRSETENMFKILAQDDLTFEMLVNNIQKPILLGTEPRWVWLLEQLIRDTNLEALPMGEANDLRNLLPILSKIRSEIAFARTGRFLVKNGKNKKAVIVYGYNHIKHFEALRDMCSINGGLFNLK